MKVNQTNELLKGVFEWILSVSVMAAITVVLIMLTQRVLHKRIKPRWHYLLWLLVMVRLLLPWDLESDLSIYNWIAYSGGIHEIDSVVQIGTQERLAAVDSVGTILYRYSMYVWLLGIVVFGIYTVVINRKFARKITKETSPITDAGILQLFSRCQELMSVHKPVTLVVSDQLTMPTLFGFWKPRLVIPQRVINSLSQEQLRHIFLHELAHCKRNDIGINWIMQFLLIIHWFNPVLWYANQRMREDQEIASDALALSYLEPAGRDSYGYTLIQLLESYVRPVSVPGNVNLSGSKSQLKRRIIMIKQFQFNSYRWSFVGLAAVLIISGCSLTNATNTDKQASAPPSSPAIDQKTTETTNTANSTDTTNTSTQTTDTDKKPETTGDTQTINSVTPTAPPKVTAEEARPTAVVSRTNESKPSPVASVTEARRAAAQAAESPRQAPAASRQASEVTAVPSSRDVKRPTAVPAPVPDTRPAQAEPTARVLTPEQAAQ
ncbi:MULTISPECIES: M56 family metallopeptidase [Paenibacillus]|uniref:M56 family metallopeptidase n=1 Tax=Paenibacillus violae TaxID=3077234 RepID=A0ABU3RK21_9BACL|nr:MULTISPECIES: M56 family metallopeptidase [Paenibacillus]MDU0204369.1 M56 family metallopeptidase [Paenibacillus sp. PFR10]MEC0269945.1 M56 family metallopeptidase [Paenibacillus anseongense]